MKDEKQIEVSFIDKLKDLNYTYREDIRDKASLEANFRMHFQRLNKVNLSDSEFARLRDGIITADVFTAAKTLREINTFKRDDDTPLQYTLVNIKDWCKNEFEVINQLRINTDNSNHRYDVMILINGVPVVQIELKSLQITPKKAMEQIVDYKNDLGNGYANSLLCFMQLFIVSNESKTYYFANNHNEHFCFDADERFLPIYQFADEDNNKISRGEENIFIWCFFLAVVQLVVDKEESYNWVKYIYVDDPISSLDDNNVIAVASHLAQLMSGNNVKVIVSSHHTLFFNVLCNEINNAEQLFLQKNIASGTYILKDTTKTPFFHHVALLKELKKASASGELYTYHFNILRNILEKTASFHGYAHFSSCIRKGADEDDLVYTRIVNLLSHGNYSLFDPREMVEENKEHFKTILKNFLEDYNFNTSLFEDDRVQEGQE